MSPPAYVHKKKLDNRSRISYLRHRYESRNAMLTAVVEIWMQHIMLTQVHVHKSEGVLQPSSVTILMAMIAPLS